MNRPFDLLVRNAGTLFTSDGPDGGTAEQLLAPIPRGAVGIDDAHVAWIGAEGDLPRRPRGPLHEDPRRGRRPGRARLRRLPHPPPLGRRPFPRVRASLRRRRLPLHREGGGRHRLHRPRGARGLRRDAPLPRPPPPAAAPRPGNHHRRGEERLWPRRRDRAADAQGHRPPRVAPADPSAPHLPLASRHAAREHLLRGLPLAWAKGPSGGRARRSRPLRRRLRRGGRVLPRRGPALPRGGPGARARAQAPRGPAPAPARAPSSPPACTRCRRITSSR